MSNAADKSTAMQIVRSGGFLWLNHIAISVVICNRGEVVEYSYLKPYWRYLLIVDRIRDSSTFAAVQRSEICRYEVPMEVFLPGFGIGINNLAARWLDDENDLPFKVIATFSALRFALSSIPSMVLHSLVTSVFWSKVSTKSLHVCLLCV